MGCPSDKFNFNQADINGDGVVNIADMIGIMNVIKPADAETYYGNVLKRLMQ